MTDAAPDSGSLPLERYGWSDHWSELYGDAVTSTGAGDAARPGRVVRHDGVAVMVAMADGIEQLPVRGNLDAPTVGDWVVVDGGAVSAILPRTSLMRRRDPDKDVEQALAANVDLVAVVCGLDRPLKDGRIQRSVMLAWDAGAAPLIVLTKADLFADVPATVEYVEAANPGVEVITVDSKGGAGVERVAEVVRGKTVVLVGESGAGKSTLTNALAGSCLLYTSD
ncbi:MAG: GTPase RsgA, partial [Acidimicrobiia bacterium]|nr:GTPase RsgA [Acidimicrobiia bacterium]